MRKVQFQRCYILFSSTTPTTIPGLDHKALCNPAKPRSVKTSIPSHPHSNHAIPLLPTRTTQSLSFPPEPRNPPRGLLHNRRASILPLAYHHSPAPSPFTHTPLPNESPLSLSFINFPALSQIGNLGEYHVTFLVHGPCASSRLGAKPP